MTTTTQTIQNLLSQVSAISKKYEKISEITGQNFNIFSILRLESDEVRLHSRFIKELLSPKGSHGQGSKFLELFIETIRQENEKLKELNYGNQDLLEATLEIEENIRREDITITNNYGRIDLVIKPRSPAMSIVIENKIFAGDQDKQMLRYRNIYPKAIHLYLTLDGKQPEPRSIKDESRTLKVGEDFHCISYKSHITKWLVKCQRTAVNLPLLRETLKQYLNLINYLTGQTMNDAERNSIVEELTKNNENIKATLLIKESFDQVLRKLMDGFKAKIKETLSAYAPDFDKDESGNDKNFGLDRAGFIIKRKEWNHCEIRFEFGGPYGGFYYGVHPTSKDYFEIIRKNIVWTGIGKHDKDWPWYDYILEGNFFDSQTFIDLQIQNKESSIYEIIKDKVVSLSKVIEEIEGKLNGPTQTELA